jgi:hypothetical protein
LANLVQSEKPFRYAGVDIMVRDDVIEQMAAIRGVEIGTPLEHEGTTYLRDSWNTYVFKANSVKELPTWIKCGWKFDLILVDGDHNYSTVLQDLQNVEQLAHAATLFVIDDYNGRFAEQDLFYSEKPEYSDINLGDRTSLAVEGKCGVRQAVVDWYSSMKARYPDREYVTNTEYDPAVIFNRNAVTVEARTHEQYPFLRDYTYLVKLDPAYRDCSNWDIKLETTDTPGVTKMFYVFSQEASEKWKTENPGTEKNDA